MNTTPVNPPNSVNVISIAFGKMPGSPSGPLPATSARPINGTKQDGLRDRVQTEPRYCLDVAVKDDAARQRTDVRLFGAATFVQLPKLADALEHLPGEREVHIHLGNIAYIDHASLDLLRNFERTRRRRARR